MPSYRDVILATPGIRTYHRLNGGASEASIGPDTALMTHTGSPVSAPGLVAGGDSAKRYSGTGMESSFSSSAFSSATAGSMECWFREDSLVDWAHIFEQDDYPSSRLQIIRWANSATITVGFRDPVAGSDFNATGPYVQYAINHVVATFDGSFLRLFVNGVQVAATAMTGFFPAGTRTFRVNKQGSQQHAGVTDEPALYTVALSPATVAQHHKVGRAAGLLKGLLLPV